MRAAIGRHKSTIIACSIIAAIYLVIFIVLDSIKTFNNAGWYDASHYHLRAINAFIILGFGTDFPFVTPISPGLYVLCAAIARALGETSVTLNSWSIRLVPAILVLASLQILFFAFRAMGASVWRAGVLLIPIAASKYLWLSALYPLTESLSFFGYAVAAYAATRPRLSSVGFGIGCAIATAARQIFLPVSLAGVLIAVQQTDDRKRPWHLLVRAAIMVAPSALIVGMLFLIWGGLIPPGFKEHKAWFNPAAILHGVMLVGLFGVLFLRPSDLVPLTRVRRDIVYCAAFALAAWLAFDLTPNETEGRWASVVWTIAEYSPHLLHRPIALLPLIGLGAFTLVVTWRRGMRDIGRAPPELIMFACYLLAQAGQAYSWQRYIECIALTFLSLSQARVREADMRFDAPMIAIFIAYLAISARYI
jgi:hypothetical protein